MATLKYFKYVFIKFELRVRTKLTEHILFSYLKFLVVKIKFIRFNIEIKKINAMH